MTKTLHFSQYYSVPIDKSSWIFDDKNGAYYLWENGHHHSQICNYVHFQNEYMWNPILFMCLLNLFHFNHMHGKLFMLDFDDIKFIYLHGFDLLFHH